MNLTNSVALTLILFPILYFLCLLVLLEYNLIINLRCEAYNLFSKVKSNTHQSVILSFVNCICILQFLSLNISKYINCCFLACAFCRIMVYLYVKIVLKELKL